MKFIKMNRLQWTENVERMTEDRIPERGERSTDNWLTQRKTANKMFGKSGNRRTGDACGEEQTCQTTDRGTFRHKLKDVKGKLVL